MKICMLSTVHAVDDIRITQKEAAALAAHGHHVTVVARPGGKCPASVKVHTLDFTAASRSARAWVGAQHALSAIESLEPDVVHFHDPELIPLGLRLKSRGYRVIYDVHEDVPADVMSKAWIPRPARKLVAWAMTQLERYAAPRFDAIVAATPTIGERLASYGANVTVVRNFASLAEFSFSANSVPRARQAVYVGRISFDRGLKDMVEACTALQLPLVLAGPAGQGEADYLASCPALIDWRGVQDRASIARLLTESGVGLCVLHPAPNYLDALPIKLFEYMAAGVPVIASDLPATRRIVEESGCGRIVPPGDHAALSAALRELIDDPNRNDIGKQGLAAVRAHYNWEAESAALIRLYTALPEAHRK